MAARALGLALLPSLVGGCAADAGGEAPPGNPGAAATVATVELGTREQTIDGFGASSAWTAPDLSDELSDELFSVNRGIGLSLLRLRIAPDGTTGELETAKKAIERGARVWASPWSPPGEWKTSGTAENGGALLAAHYDDWAERLASFAASCEEQGVSLLELSAQNEPNFEAGWETCKWQPGELTRFIGDHLGPALDARGVDVRVLAPETQDWRTLAEYAGPLLDDAAASSYVGVIAVHGYDGANQPFPRAAESGRELWVTELDDNLRGDQSSGFDPGMSSGLKVAQKLHDDLGGARASAWHYWWLMPRGDLPLRDNGALTDGESLTRRAYVLGNFSRFVRPGFVRVDATSAPQRDVRVTAFRDAPGARLVIVATNLGSSDVSQGFAVAGGTLDSVTPFVTSDAFALEEGTDEPVVDGSFTVTLGARSVTTFVADVTEAAEPQPPPAPERQPQPVSTESGCSCRTAGPRAGAAPLVALLALLFAARRRRSA